MKKIKIFIIPHNPNEKHKKFNIHIFIILFFSILIVSLGIFTYINLSRYIDTSSISSIENDNRSLKKYIEQLEREMPLLSQQIDSLKKIQNEIMSKYKLFPDEKNEFNLSKNIDSILNYIIKVDSIFDFANKEISKYKDFFPSIYPVAGRIVRRFGKAYDYYTERWKPFNGIGIASKSGEPVIATAFGIVEKIGNNKEMGNYIIINHNNIFKTTYAHLGNINVSQGQRIKRGQVIGNLGKSGKIPYPILYYEIKKGEIYVNPEAFILEEI